MGHIKYASVPDTTWNLLYFFIIELIQLNIYMSNVFLSVHFRSLEHLIVSNQHWTQNLCLDFQLSLFIYGYYSLKYISYIVEFVENLLFQSPAY